MKMKAIIDSSTLISLAKIDALWVFNEMECEMICPDEVYRECVVMGSLNGRVDAVQIKRLFDEKTVSAKTVEVKERIPGLSTVDCMVLALAVQEKPGIVFANDTKLARRIELAGFDARGSPDILLRMKRKGILDDKGYSSLIKLVGTKMRLSASNVEKYLEAEK